MSQIVFTNSSALRVTTTKQYDYLNRLLSVSSAPSAGSALNYADGNLSSDGRWNYTWDAENRLVAMTNISTVPTGAKMALTFAYDSKGRRIQKQVFTWNSGWVLSSDSRFIYDSWNLLAILNPQSSLLQSFTWGLDLSGSEQGAGGVGGLLKMCYFGSQSTNCFPAFDGNGNDTALINAADGTTVANYEYGPFGEVVRASGPIAKESPLRFSTKYQDDESDLLYYGHRSYNASTGRWISRDPIEEEGGLDLYAMISNRPCDSVDLLGECSPPPRIPCGVDKIILKRLKFIMPPGGAAVTEVVLINFTHDTAHDPTACRVVPRVRASERVNGVRFSHNSAGVPYDGNWHVDTNPWKGPNDDDYFANDRQYYKSPNGNVKGNAQLENYLKGFSINPNDWDFVAIDTPNIRNLKNGDQVVKNWIQQVLVIDFKNKSQIAEVDTPLQTIEGSYPNLSYTPQITP